ncbi:MAG: thioredoxin [Candidatus Daviesbacteria bacterium]|nr:thioredoxin [Candidatus Daviesbacteria bacterium]
MAVKLLDFWAEWCGPCRVMAPVLEEIKKELGSKIEVEEINVDEKPQEAQKFGVMSIPTYIIMKDDKEVGRKIGVTAKQELLELLNG